jgi:hypothetical protein
MTAEKLRRVGVESIGVVGTAADRARRYFGYRKPRYLVGADPELTSHRAFGVPSSDFTDEMMKAVVGKLDALARDAGVSAPPGGGWEALDRADGIKASEFASDVERHKAQLTAQYLIDPEGVIRWANIETERDGLEGLDRFPSDDELLAAAEAL